MSQNVESRSPSDHLRLAVPWLLFAIAFGFRLVGIGWGLPHEHRWHSLHPDEEPVLAAAQRIEPARLSFTPGFYNYGTLYLTTLRIASDIGTVYGGAPRGDTEVQRAEIRRLSHLSGRVVSALAGAGLALMVFLMVRRFSGTLGGIFAGGVMAFAPGLVVHSRFQTTDVLATFLLSVSLYFALRLLPGHSDTSETAEWDKAAVKLVALSALFAGLSAGTKYTGILALLSLGAAVVASGRRPLAKPLLLLVGVALGAFVLATPGILFDSAAFFRDVRYEMLHTATGHGLVFEGVAPGYLYHIRNLAEGMGPFALLMCMIGLVYASVKRVLWIWVLLAFFIAYYVLIGRAEVLFLRYTFPLYIALAAGLGWWMSYLHQRGGATRIVVGLGIFALGATAINSSRMTSWMAAEDPRDRAARDLAQPGTSVGLVSDPWFYTPPFVPNAPAMRNRLPQIYGAMAQSQAPRTVQYLPANPDERFAWDVRLLTELEPDFVIYSSFEVVDVARLSNRSNLSPLAQLQVDRFKEFHQALEQRYVQIIPPWIEPGDLARRYRSADYLVHDLQYIQPVMWLWQRKPAEVGDPPLPAGAAPDQGGEAEP